MSFAVDRGIAKSAGAAGTIARHLGGKTGSGPEGVLPSDGWFTGLIFDGAKPRYAIAVYALRHGPGDGAAAGSAADVTRLVAASP